MSLGPPRTHREEGQEVSGHDRGTLWGACRKRQKEGWALQAAEKGLLSYKIPKKHTAGAKAHQ
jgi:hypothetical protein